MSIVRLHCVKNYTFAQSCAIRRSYFIYGCLCPASPSNEIIFVSNSLAVCGSFTITVRILWPCKKTTLSNNSARFRGITSFMVASVCSIAHKWNIFVGNSSAVVCVDHPWAQSDYFLWLCKRTTFSHNFARFRRVTSFLVASVFSLAHKCNNFCRQFVGSLWIIHEHCQTTLFKKLYFRAITRDSEELFHIWLRLCPASPSNEIISSAIRRQSVDHSRTRSDYFDCVKKYIFAQFCAIQRSYFIYGCICV